MGQEGMRKWVEACHSIVRKMREAQKPLLAAIHGTAVGGGREIVLHCDVRFAAASAKLGQPEINIAFIPPVGTTQSLPRLLGRPRALRLLYEGTLVSAEEALGMGLVDFVVPAERLRQEVQRWGLARWQVRRSPGGHRRCTITTGLEMSDDDALAIELEAAVHLAGTPDFSEGLAAFFEKATAEMGVARR